MKKQISLLFFPVLLLIINAFYTPPQPVEQIQAVYLRDMAVFENSLKKLKTEGDKDPLSISDLKMAFKEARLAYKKVAWLIGYLEPENEKCFNGPPLSKVETINFTEIAPLGFQPIEEIIFGDDLETELPKLRLLITDLLFYAQKWTEQMTTQPLSDREIFEAFRTELTQLFALSLTGFDSPVAFHSIPEAKVAWSNLATHFNFYQKNLQKKEPNLCIAIEKTFQEGERYLVDNQDFNTFDRLLFYKKYLSVLYLTLLKAQQVLGIETYALTGNLARAWNDEAASIFDKNFINPRFYSAKKQYDFIDQPERVELGKLLFFDPILSSNGKRACASCHNADKAFAENLPKSLDLAGKPIARNAPSLLYAALATTQFWDGHARSVEEQMGHVASNSQEMGNQLEDLPVRLGQSKAYIELFQKAFPSETQSLNIGNIEKSVGAYLRSLSVFDSEFDHYMRGETDKIAPDVQKGFNLFMGKAKCGTCHFAPVFNGTVPPQYQDTEFEVIGVPDLKNQLDGDLGRYNSITADKYLHSFKTVTVRNVALTKPYMHNGRYKTLEEVVDFYNKGGGTGMGLDVPNQTLPFDKLDLTKKEVGYIVKFMEALTDKNLPKAPEKLPEFDNVLLSKRKIGGEY